MAEDVVVNKVIYLRTDDNKYSMGFNLFNARIDVAVFDNSTKGGPIIKGLFTYTGACNFKHVLKKMLVDQETKPITVGFDFWNADLKQREFKCNLTTGRDDDKCLYFEVSGDRHKDPVRFYLVTDQNLLINEMTLPKKSLTEAGCRAIIDFFSELMRLSISAPSRRNTGTEGSGGTGGGTDGGSNVGEDIPF